MDADELTTMQANMAAEPSADQNGEIRLAARFLRQAQHGVALTGAGISTPSGIPDFRSLDCGLWQRYDPRQVATLSAFRYRPEKFFQWLRSIALEINQALPNPAHDALAKLQKLGHIRSVVTQNVDSLHQRAGSYQVHEVHGSLMTLTCVRCYHKYYAEPYLPDFLALGTIPTCPECSGILKPDVILFEEQLPYKTWRAAQDSCRQADLILVIGSSLEVMPVAGLPMLALENNAPLIIINKSPTYLDVRADVILRDNVAEVLPRILAEVQRDS